MAAGFQVTKQQIDQNFASDLATIRNALFRLHDRYTAWWVPNGAAGYVALGGIQADADTLGSAINEGILLYKIFTAQSIIASGGAVSDGAGHDFLTFINRVCGDNVT